MLRLDDSPRQRFVFSFGDGEADGSKELKDLLGGKGAGLAEMTRIGLPVPPGFTVSTEVCTLFMKEGRVPDAVEREIRFALERLEARAGRRLGDPSDPLLVSVRSGAKFSMPGMMDTVLNLGLNDRTVEGVAARTGNRRFAFDSYRRFILMFGSIAMGVERRKFDAAFDALKKKHGFASDVDVTAEVLEREVVPAFRAIFEEETGRPFPQEVLEQLSLARDAVFRSWGNERAVSYRRQFHIPDDLGTAVNVQAMVFGNKGDSSCTGVGFTRDPGTGEKTFYGEFLVNAQGEDVVAGIRTPQPLAEMKSVLPAAHEQLFSLTQKLERHYHWPQDFEFTVEEGKLFLLQTRNAKSTAFAAIRWVDELLEEGVITEEEALLNVEPQSLDQLLHPVFDPKARQKITPVAKGLPAGPGAASGRIVFSAEEAEARSRGGERVVLVRKETCPDDIQGMISAKGILTATGGMTSHAAVVGRQLGKPCVVGCGALLVDERARTLTIGTRTAKEGDFISIDGATGEVCLADLPTVDSEILRVMTKGEEGFGPSSIGRAFAKLMALTDRHRTMKVRTNADQPKDARLAFAFGAEGIGLCRTEHMFFAEERLPAVVQMILSAKRAREGLRKREAIRAERSGAPLSREAKRALKAVDAEYGEAISLYEGALATLLRFQKKDFAGIFREMRGHPVTIRTLDPPLHEFLPKREELSAAIERVRSGRRLPKDAEAEVKALLLRGDAANRFKGTRVERLEKLLALVEELHEFNPMLGHRGCRLGITYPEITAMQAKAIFEAAVKVKREGHDVRLEIMVPLVGAVKELALQKAIILRAAKEVLGREEVEVPYQVGVMIEVPRAALTADQIAAEAEFFSFGTNDLTQMTFGYSRDDAGKFLHQYVDEKVLPRDPFVSLDPDGVGELVRIAVEKGRATRPSLKLGICGEHGGDPASVELCQTLGLDYVSCSPFRVPVARLAAAQAAIRARRAEASATAPGTTGLSGSATASS